MSNPEKALAERIRELRRRHFGPRGKDQFARQLGISPEEYGRYERGTLPPGEVMVRLCELTGEDLQWLLTGVAARGTVVISGARNRHRTLLTEIAQALDARPGLAAPLEAFLELLLRSQDVRKSTTGVLPAPAADELIPIFDRNEWPEELPDPDGPGGGVLGPPAADLSLASVARDPAHLAEPAMAYGVGALRDVAVIEVPSESGPVRRFVQSREVARCFPGVFGAFLDDGAMEPMLATGDVVLVAAGAPARIGHPALCKFADRADDRCRVWLGEDEQFVHLGRVSDGEHEQMPRPQLRWSLEVLYRVARAA